MNCDVHRVSFIIRIWLEETAQEVGVAKWRGHITHVPSGTQRYIEDLGEIPTFIAPYLGKMGVRLCKHGRVQHLLRLFVGRPGRRPRNDGRSTD